MLKRFLSQKKTTYVGLAYSFSSIFSHAWPNVCHLNLLLREHFRHLILRKFQTPGAPKYKYERISLHKRVVEGLGYVPGV